MFWSVVPLPGRRLVQTIAMAAFVSLAAPPFPERARPLALAADPWASAVVAYVPGTGVNPQYTDPAAALGPPTRFTGGTLFPAAVTPFNPPWMPYEIVSIGAGGSLTLRFDTPITNDPAHPFGIDLIVFGNAGFIDTGFPAGIAGPLFGAGRGRIEVSGDGVNWFTIPGVEADALYPTLGYADLSDPYATTPGQVLTDFTRPVNPALDPTGLTFAQLVAAYDGSGGGAGVDLATVGLTAAPFVRITNPHATGTVEIDALARVPTPGTLLLIFSALAPRRRRPSHASRPRA